MDFKLNETQEMLQESARRLFGSEYEGEKAHVIDECADGFSSDVWSQMVALGWNAVSLPESVGGSDLGLIELCILAEEIGRAGASSPLLVSAGLSAMILSALADDNIVATELLTILATTDSIVTAALIDKGSRDERTAPSLKFTASGEAITLSGVKQLVPYAAHAKVLIVSGQLTDGTIALAAVDADSAGINMTRHKVMGGDPRYLVSFENVAIPSDRILASGPDATAALDVGLQATTVMAMAEVVGNCEGILTLTAEYAKIREQFGTAIGRFQAVSHPIADMRIQTDACRMLAIEAAWLIDANQPAAFEIASAKIYINEAVATIAVDGQRLHGAIGYSNEYDLQLYTRRAKSFTVNWGNTEQQVEAAAAALGI